MIKFNLAAWQKISIAVLISVSLLVVGVWVFKREVGDVRPVILPPAKLGDKPETALKLPDGFKIGIFATDLGAVRDIEFSREGTLLVSSSGEGRLWALPDKNQDGRADQTKLLLDGRDKLHGLAFNDGSLYVAEETKVSRFKWDEASLSLSSEEKILDLPAAGRHFTRTIAFNKSGQMFVSIGSTCDVCFEAHEWLAAIIVSDVNGKNARLYAKGLRNAVFITVNPDSGDLWATEMGRDGLGDDIPPDEINIIRDGKDYGWPNCYGSKVADTDFNKSLSETACVSTEPPVFKIQAHSAPLGLSFIKSPRFPEDWQGDLLVAYHGSWNRSEPVGYRVVRLEIADNQVKAEHEFLNGFLSGSDIYGRPVDMDFDRDGSLYISDDKAGLIYKIAN